MQLLLSDCYEEKSYSHIRVLFRACAFLYKNETPRFTRKNHITIINSSRSGSNINISKMP
ncbi:LOW QUALITY PROTEIN: hypothetical protein HZS_254 [Henneguya salminicola]|nr:LOW QUALITY PROTEIN: hypothetical protein HZS_254 [Henneguya salminicola]